MLSPQPAPRMTRVGLLACVGRRRTVSRLCVPSMTSCRSRSIRAEAMGTAGSCRAPPPPSPSGQLPFALVLFLAWSLAAGEHRLLPWVALVASFTLQAQITYILPVLGVLAVSIAFLVARRRAIPRRVLVVTAIVGLVCWSLPIAEE